MHSTGRSVGSFLELADQYRTQLSRYQTLKRCIHVDTHVQVAFLIPGNGLGYPTGERIRSQQPVIYTA